jgi:hypothetical protein
MAKDTNQQKTVEVGSAFDLLPKSWEIVKKNWKAFAVVNVLSILSALAALSPDYDKGPNNFMAGPTASLSGWELGTVLGLGLIIGLILVAISIILYAMHTKLQVKSSAGKQPSIKELFDTAIAGWFWLRLFVLLILASLMVIAGLILLIIPGIIIFGRIVMAPYFMADKDSGILDSLKASNELSKNNTGKVWAAIGVTVLIAIAAGIINSVPQIGPLIGTLFGIAFSLILVLRYQQIKNLKTVTVKK